MRFGKCWLRHLLRSRRFGVFAFLRLPFRSPRRGIGTDAATMRRSANFSVQKRGLPIGSPQNLNPKERIMALCSLIIVATIMPTGVLASAFSNVMRRPKSVELVAASILLSSFFANFDLIQTSKEVVRIALRPLNPCRCHWNNSRSYLSSKNCHCKEDTTPGSVMPACCQIATSLSFVWKQTSVLWGKCDNSSQVSNDVT